MKKAQRKSTATVAKKAAESEPSKDGNWGSQAALALRIDVSRPRVGQFVAEGVFQPRADGKLDLDACTIAYIRWLRDEARRSSKSAAATRVQDARAREIEMRIAREEHTVVEMDEVEAVVSDILGTFRSELSGVPAASTRDLPLRAKIEKQLNGAIDRCRSRFEKASDALRTGREVSLDGEEADA